MADHYSGPQALARPAVDITDLYVFPSPQQEATARKQRLGQ